jgi:hypothetical protein
LFSAGKNSMVETDTSKLAPSSKDAIIRHNRSPAPLKEANNLYPARKLHSASQAVAQLDLFSGKVLCVHASQVAAATAVTGHQSSLGMSNSIAKCCKGHGGSSAGFKWRYATNEEAAKAIQRAPRKPRTKSHVAQLDPTSGVTIDIHRSMAAAARAVGVRGGSGISRCCDGKKSSCSGFHWRLATNGEIDNSR